MKTEEIRQIFWKFEQIAYEVNCVDCWSARELQELLGYSEWETFSNVIDKAKATCNDMRHNVSKHFVESPKIISFLKDKQRNIGDVLLTRYACYLIAQSGDSRKPQINFARIYFAVQTCRTERWKLELECLKVLANEQEKGKRLSCIQYEFRKNEKSFSDLPLFVGTLKRKFRHRVQCFKENSKTGVIVDDIVVIPPVYENIKLIPVGMNDEDFKGCFKMMIHWGYGGSLEMVVPSEIKDINLISIDVEFYAVVSKTINGNTKYGVLSHTNEEICPIIYDNIVSYGDYALKLVLNNKYYCFDVRNNSPIVEIDNYDHIGFFHAVVSQFEREDEKDFIDKIHWTEIKYSVVKKSEKLGIVLNDGTVLIQPTFKKIDGFTFSHDHGLCNMIAKVEFEDGIEGWIDYRGLLYGIIPNVYKSVQCLSENRFVVLNNEGKYGIIDASCQVISDYIYDDYYKWKRHKTDHLVSRDFVIFHNENGWTIVDAITGSYTNYYEWVEWIDYHVGKYCYVKYNQKIGVINSFGEEVIPCKYDKISGFSVNKGISASSVILEGESGSIVDAKFIKKAINDKRSNFQGRRNWGERQTFERYHGTYAQDEMGYSDDDIETIFDGDPSAYWNID